VDVRTDERKVEKGVGAGVVNGPFGISPLGRVPPTMGTRCPGETPTWRNSADHDHGYMLPDMVQGRVSSKQAFCEAWVRDAFATLREQLDVAHQFQIAVGESGDGGIGVLETEDEHGPVVAPFGEGVHVLHIDARLLDHPQHVG